MVKFVNVNILECDYRVMPISMITKAKELKLYLYIYDLSAYGLKHLFQRFSNINELELSLRIRRLLPLFYVKQVEQQLKI